jgi:hypothetical protein
MFGSRFPSLLCAIVASVANPDHLSRLAEASVEEWNRWRTQTLAELGEPDLSEEYLNAEQLCVPNFSGADLRGTDLRGANFSEADLTGADLRRTTLYQANFNGANLSGADLSEANVGRTIFGDLDDLSDVKGLDTLVHLGPSTLGIDTVYKSAGKLPEIFLRGVGVPATFITYLGSRVGKPNEFHSCFISYSSPRTRNSRTASSPTSKLTVSGAGLPHTISRLERSSTSKLTKPFACMIVFS